MNRNALKKKIRRRKSSWIWNIKNKSKCERCPETHPATLQFHHVSGKMMDIGRMVQNTYSNRKIREEIEKCVVLCANCHAKEHYEEKECGGTPNIYIVNKAQLTMNL
jgi:hypothetical protein